MTQLVFAITIKRMIQYKLDERQFAAQLRKLGFPTISQFAKRHDINRATLNNYLKGRGPLPESFYAIADALKLDPIQLLVPMESHQAIPKLEEIAPIITACSKVSPDIAVGLMGSRAVGSAQKYSDWDLGVTAGLRQLSTMEFLKIKQLVDDLAEDLPRAVDAINLDAAPEWFLKGVQYTPKFLAGNESSWAYFMGVLHGVQKAA